MINIFVFIVFISISISVFYLAIDNVDIYGRFIYAIFVILATVERLWETFFIQKGEKIRSFHGDWSLIFTIVTYYIVSLLSVIYFYDEPYKNIYFTSLGVILFILATLIRFWSVKLLGNNWNIHLVEKFQNVSPSSLIYKGPYKISRHPIYLAAILELFGLILISNAYYYVMIVLFINIPLYIWRARHEEAMNIKKFGDHYINYMNTTSFMLPYRIRKNKNV